MIGPEAPLEDLGRSGAEGAVSRGVVLDRRGLGIVLPTGVLDGVGVAVGVACSNRGVGPPEVPVVFRIPARDVAVVKGHVDEREHAGSTPEPQLFAGRGDAGDAGPADLRGLVPPVGVVALVT